MKQQIHYVLGRDGLQAAIDYAKQTRTVYQKAIRVRKPRKLFVHDPHYRRHYVQGLLEIRTFMQSVRALEMTVSLTQE